MFLRIMTALVIPGVMIGSHTLFLGLVVASSSAQTGVAVQRVQIPDGLYQFIPAPDGYVPNGILPKWSLSPSYDARVRNLECPLSPSESAAMSRQDVEAEPPGFVVINRYRESPQIQRTYEHDVSKRLEPQPGMKVVYARTSIDSDRDQVKKLNIGYSDDISAFLNGKILYRGRSAQNYRDPDFLGIVNLDNDMLYIPLNKGRNELVLAVGEIGGGWGFICRLEDYWEN